MKYTNKERQLMRQCKLLREEVKHLKRYLATSNLDNSEWVRKFHEACRKNDELFAKHQQLQDCHKALCDSLVRISRKRKPAASALSSGQG